MILAALSDSSNYLQAQFPHYLTYFLEHYIGKLLQEP